ncbi:MAG: choice-of-anchor C family protein [Pseudomonadota bacterium]
MRTLTKLAAIAATAAFWQSSVEALPFQNGSFENASFNPGVFTTLGNGNSSITGWTVGTGSIDYIGTLWQADDGARSIDLSGGTLGRISQTFDTVIGGDYRVIFALAGNVDGGPAIKTGTVSAGNAAQNFSFDATGFTRLNMGWIDVVFEFQAVAASTTLTFVSTTIDPNGPEFYGPALDNVRLSRVPEPMTLGLLGAGLFGVAGMRRRRK